MVGYSQPMVLAWMTIYIVKSAYLSEDSCKTLSFPLPSFPILVNPYETRPRFVVPNLL